MSPFETFPIPHDPDDTGDDYEFDWVLQAGETPSSFTLTQVNSTSTAPVSPPTITFANAFQFRVGTSQNYPVSFEPVVDPSITFPLVIDGLPAAEVFIRCRLQTSLRQADKTVRLIIRQK